MQPDTQAALEKELFRLFDSYDTMGACVAVFQNGHVTYTYCYGTRTNGGEAVTPDSLFQCGSISKMAGNIGLMQLVEEQQIPLDTDVGQLLGFPVRHPEYPELPITLRQVMTHTASLNDSSAYSGGLDGDGRTLQQLFSGDWAAASFLPGVKPGTKSVYSNLGGGMMNNMFIYAIYVALIAVVMEEGCRYLALKSIIKTLEGLTDETDKIVEFCGKEYKDSVPNYNPKNYDL